MEGFQKAHSTVYSLSVEPFSEEIYYRSLKVQNTIITVIGSDLIMHNYHLNSLLNCLS